MVFTDVFEPTNRFSRLDARVFVRDVLAYLGLHVDAQLLLILLSSLPSRHLLRYSSSLVLLSHILFGALLILEIPLDLLLMLGLDGLGEDVNVLGPDGVREPRVVVREGILGVHGVFALAVVEGNPSDHGVICSNRNLIGRGLRVVHRVKVVGPLDHTMGEWAQRLLLLLGCVAVLDMNRHLIKLVNLLMRLARIDLLLLGILDILHHPLEHVVVGI